MKSCSHDWASEMNTLIVKEGATAVLTPGLHMVESSVTINYMWIIIGANDVWSPRAYVPSYVLGIFHIPLAKERIILLQF